MSKFIIKNKIITIASLILVLLAIWGGQNIRERTSAQADAPRKAIRQPADMRGESGNILSEPSSPLPAEKNAVNKPEPIETPAPSKNTETVTVIAGQENIILSVAPNTIFYDALVEAQAAGKLAFRGKKYTGLGFFVTDIESLHAGDGLDLLYYINGKEASVGVSQYVLKNGDVLEWKLE